MISRTMSSCTAWLRYLEERESELVDADAEGILDIDDGVLSYGAALLYGST